MPEPCPAVSGIVLWKQFMVRRVPSNPSPRFAPDVDPALHTGIVARVSGIEEFCRVSRGVAKADVYTATVTDVSVRVTGRYNVSRSIGSRPAVRISRSNSSRRMPCGVVAPAS